MYQYAGGFPARHRRRRGTTGPTSSSGTGPLPPEHDPAAGDLAGPRAGAQRIIPGHGGDGGLRRGHRPRQRDGKHLLAHQHRVPSRQSVRSAGRPRPDTHRGARALHGLHRHSRGRHGGVSDLAGDTLETDPTWTFTTREVRRHDPIRRKVRAVRCSSSAAAVTSAPTWAEILRAEGLNLFTSATRRISSPRAACPDTGWWCSGGPPSARRRSTR